jgi:hypothetical protein
VTFAWPVEEFQANRTDIEANFFATIELAPEFAERVRAATRESKFIGSAELPGYFRKPFGKGWALLGDAGYHKNRSPRWASTTPFATPSWWPMRWMTPSRGGAHTRKG